MTKQYVVTTPNNPAYQGKTYGVQFIRGRALVNEYSIDPFLKLSVDEVVELMERDFGYEVEELGGAKVDPAVYLSQFADEEVHEEGQDDDPPAPVKPKSLKTKKARGTKRDTGAAPAPEVVSAEA